MSGPVLGTRDMLDDGKYSLPSRSSQSSYKSTYTDIFSAGPYLTRKSRGRNGQFCLGVEQRRLKEEPMFKLNPEQHFTAK